jgi:hypothetical protein
LYDVWSHLLKRLARPLEVFSQAKPFPKRKLPTIRDGQTSLVFEIELNAPESVRAEKGTTKRKKRA